MIPRWLLELSPRRIAGVYLAFGFLWIGTTDWLVVTLFTSIETITFVQTAKGWVFVALSGLLVYALTTVRQRQVENTRATLGTVSEQLQVLHRVLRHNIRNDLNVVLGSLSTIEDDLHEDDLSESDRLEALSAARRKTNQILRISDKMTVVDSLELNPDSETVDLARLVEDAVGTVRRQYPDADVSADLPDSAYVYGDSSIYRALVEVIENAIEHNPDPERECVVSVNLSAENGHVRLDVDDNAPPIPDSELESLHSGTESDLLHMSGVGLWMVKWVCECHDGDLRIDAANGKTTVGLRFRRVDRLPMVGSLAPEKPGRRSAAA